MRALECVCLCALECVCVCAPGFLCVHLYLCVCVVCVLECVCSALLVSDEDVKAAVCYVMFRIWSFSAAVQTLPDTLRQRMCVLLLHTLSNTHTTALTVNCLGETHTHIPAQTHTHTPHHSPSTVWVRHTHTHTPQRTEYYNNAANHSLSFTFAPSFMLISSKSQELCKM